MQMFSLTFLICVCFNILNEFLCVGCALCNPVLRSKLLIMIIPIMMLYCFCFFFFYLL